MIHQTISEDTMQFGLFGSTQAGDDDLGRGFHDYADYNIEAEALGYYSSFLVEHHFTGWSQVSATLQLLNWVAARTNILRVGSAVVVLPWHNPVLLAEQVATLDILSCGRVDLGVGKGYRYTEFKGFRIPIGEAEARFEEALTILVKSWTTGERFTYRGRYWSYDDIVVEPKPYQKPHPPLWMAASSESSIRLVAERGYNLLLDQYGSIEAHAERIALYHSEVKRRGGVFSPLNVAVARDLYVAKNGQDKADALARYQVGRERTLAASRDPRRLGGSHILRYDGTDTEPSMLYGTPDEIADGLEALRHAGIRYVLLHIGESRRDSLRRFARDIMPMFATD
jgi:alkanesulfonate monooxygenase SsuD/methylene tetrahydromethanopterin reductase-like flavin-dependent oxidoreductase (luciferase family)